MKEILLASCLCVLLGSSARAQHNHGADGGGGGQTQAQAPAAPAGSSGNVAAYGTMGPTPQQEMEALVAANSPPLRAEQGRRVLSFAGGQPDDQKVQAAAEAIQVERALLALDDLRRRENQIPPDQYRNKREGLFNTIDQAMIRGMNGPMHMAYMAVMEDPLNGMGYDLAKRHAMNFQRQSPGADSYNYGARLDLNKRNFDAAISQARQAASYDSNSVMAHIIMASAKLELKDFKGAAKDAQTALRLEPGNGPALGILKLTQRADISGAKKGTRDVAGMLSMLKNEGGGEKDSVGRWTSSGKVPAVQERAARYDATISYVSKAVQQDPKDLGALYARAKARILNKDLSGALEDLAAALKLSPGNATLLVAQANVLNRLGRYPEALDSAKKALAARSDDTAEAFYNLAWALAGLGERQEALKALASAARFNSVYAGRYQDAVRLPEAQDIAFLFSGIAPRVVTAGDAGLGSFGRPRSLAVWMLLGLALIALSLRRRLFASS